MKALEARNPQGCGLEETKHHFSLINSYSKPRPNSLVLSLNDIQGSEHSKDKDAPKTEISEKEEMVQEKTCPPSKTLKVEAEEGKSTRMPTHNEGPAPNSVVSLQGTSAALSQNSLPTPKNSETKSLSLFSSRRSLLSN